MRSQPRRSHLGAILCIWALHHLCSSSASCVASGRASRSIANLRSAKAAAFSSIELAKIFGRLADHSTIGSVLATPTSKLTPSDSSGKRAWRGLFNSEEEELGRAEFVKRLANAPFTWPTYYVANRQPPFLVPEKQRHKFKLKGYLGHVALQLHKPEDSSNGELSNKTLKAHAKQPLAPEAVDSVFQALSHEEEKLTVNHIIAFIKYRSPLLQMVNWEGFIASLPVGPDDIPI
ncbi:hypothetical protein BgAZ_404270 [Babesia gibsoni]|uniref:Uncharacterized protein n=1 Tax=Babesia gibsoni TaxID=33632 RepID=A0AAD8PDJ3_BABGI|nr:hypothetical protein BgAZ_404270 [Babesia gibsoni]